MPVSNAQLTQMFEHVLKLSRVDETQSVAVLKSHYSDPRTVNASFTARPWAPNTAAASVYWRSWFSLFSVTRCARFMMCSVNFMKSYFYIEQCFKSTVCS